jgi:hypothetical protein
LFGFVGAHRRPFRRLIRSVAHEPHIMRAALAVIVAFYSILALGDYHEAAVVTGMQLIMGLSIIPMCILAVCLVFSGLIGLGQAASNEARITNITIAVLASSLLFVVGYREMRRSTRPRDEAIPYTPKGANKTDAGNGSYGICRVIDASRSPSPDPRRQNHKT